MSLRVRRSRRGEDRIRFTETRFASLSGRHHFRKINELLLRGLGPLASLLALLKAGEKLVPRCWRILETKKQMAPQGWFPQPNAPVERIWNFFEVQG